MSLSRLPISLVVTALIAIFAESGKAMDSSMGCMKHNQSGGQVNRPHIALVAIGSAEVQFHHHLHQLVTWVSVVNRKAYSALHGFPLYVAASKLEHSRAPPWHKIIGAIVAMRHSCAEWVWVMDTDAFIMNMTINAADDIVGRRDVTNETNVIFAEETCNGLNTGSFFLRNTEWTWDFLSEVWATKGPHVWMSKDWWEQAAFMHIYKNVREGAQSNPNSEDHRRALARFLVLPNRIFNSYSPLVPCSAPSLYQQGDFVMHFAGWSKIPSLKAGELDKVPLMESVLNITMAATSTSLTATMSSAQASSSSRESQQTHVPKPNFHLVFEIQALNLHTSSTPPGIQEQKQQQHLITRPDVVWVNFTCHSNPSDPNLNLHQHYVLLPNSAVNDVQSLNLGWPVNVIPGVFIRTVQAYVRLIRKKVKERGASEVFSALSRLLEMGAEANR